MTSSRNAEIAVRLDEPIDPFTLPLPVPLSTAKKMPVGNEKGPEKPYTKSFEPFRDFLKFILKNSGDEAVRTERVGKLATGLLRGDFSHKTKSFPLTGAPSKAEAGRHLFHHCIIDGRIIGIEFDDPTGIYEDWSKSEPHGVGEQKQLAVRTIIDARDELGLILEEFKAVSLHLDFDVATGRE